MPSGDTGTFPSRQFAPEVARPYEMKKGLLKQFCTETSEELDARCGNRPLDEALNTRENKSPDFRFPRCTSFRWFQSRSIRVSDSNFFLHSFFSFSSHRSVQLGTARTFRALNVRRGTRHRQPSKIAGRCSHRRVIPRNLEALQLIQRNRREGLDGLPGLSLRRCRLRDGFRLPRGHRRFPAGAGGHVRD